MVKKIFQVSETGVAASLALLVLRLITGIAFMHHGWMKIQTPFSWNPPGSQMEIPAFFQFLASISEYGGGIALVLGLITPLAGFGILSTMSVAVYFHSVVRGDPFVNMTGGLSFEPALVFWGIALLMILKGPGIFSLDRLIFGKRKTKQENAELKSG